MPISRLKVLLIGKLWELPEYNIVHLTSTNQVMGTIASFRPDIILASNDCIPNVLNFASFEIQKRWCLVDPNDKLEDVVKMIEGCYNFNLFSTHPNQCKRPLMSVFTPTHNTGDYLKEAYDSLRTQTCPDWEWVVVDDGSTDKTWDRLCEYANEDWRVRPVRNGFNNGRIGAMKDMASRLCKGKYLVEFDHDDMLVDTCLEEVRKAFEENPAVGFVYSNHAAFYENGQPQRFSFKTKENPQGNPVWDAPDRYKEVEYRGKKWLECKSPVMYDRFGPNFWDLFAWTLVVGPHHVRAFRASKFFEVGGYNAGLPVADDWDIMARMFLNSQCLHIDKMLYLYRYRDGWGNETFKRNKSIQDHLALARNVYAHAFFRKNQELLNAKRKEDKDDPAFVIASRKYEDSFYLRSILRLDDLKIVVVENKGSIFKAYEEGRLACAGHRTIVYLHDDVEFVNEGIGVEEFLRAIKGLAEGVYGVIGTASPKALDVATPWWTLNDLRGRIKQKTYNGETIIDNTKEASPATMLDGLCLVTVDQKWSWKLPGKLPLWNAYDWLACKKATGGVFVLPQPDKPIFMHKNLGGGQEREDKLMADIAKVKVLSRTVEERRDYPNIKDHLPRLEQEAHGFVLELGCREGASTGALLTGVEKNGGKVWSVDIDPAYSKIWEGHPQWTFFLGSTLEPENTFLDLVQLEQPAIDVLFIDTEHTYKQASKELEIYLPWVKKGGTVILHDTEEFTGVRQAIDEVANKIGAIVEHIKGCKGLSVMKVPKDVSSGPRGLSGPAGETSHGDAIGPQGKGPDHEGTQGAVNSPLSVKGISFIVLDALGEKNIHIFDCIESIRKCAPGSQIVLVGNGVVSKAKDLVDKYVQVEGNIGFAAGCNLGARSADRDVLCFINDDAKFVDVVTPLCMIHACAYNRKNDIVGAYSNNAKPQQQVASKANVPVIDVVVPMVVGLCMMVQKKTFFDLKGFDTSFSTFEDDDLCVRAKKLGVKSIITGGAYVEHADHKTFEGLGLDVNQIMQRNKAHFAKKHNAGLDVIVIAKNESKALHGFYDQFKGIADQFCLLDTGSDDDTIEKAKSLGFNVAKSEKPFDFATARNEALQVFARSEWVIMVDPDERLSPGGIAAIPELIANSRHDIYLSRLQALYPDGSTRTFVSKPFLFRNNGEIKWVFKVHEKLIGSHKQALVTNMMNTHVIELHEDGRRQNVEGFYSGLMAQEPYHTDAAYREKMKEEWPILDYQRLDDVRLEEIQIGQLVSVIIPTYDRIELLTKAVDSALAQTYQNIEVIVVGDNCPKLQSQLEEMKRMETIPDLRGGCDPRVRFLNLPTNHGSGGAVPRNVAISMAQGDYIAYLDDDNEWNHDHVATIMQAIQDSKKSWGFSSMSVKGHDMQFTEPKFQEIDTSCVIHPKEFFYKYGPWKDRVEGGYAHDWEYISRFAHEPWVCTKNPTLLYNAVSSGQEDFLIKKIEDKARQMALEVNQHFDKMLEKVKPIYKSNLLSIGILGLTSRDEMRSKLVGELNSQISSLPNINSVEVIVNVDDGSKTTGAKRQEVVDQAKGEYICFIDDDDWVDPNYLNEIFLALASKPDCVTFKGLITTDGKNPEEFNFSLDYPQNIWEQDAKGVHMRCPSTFCPIKSSIAKQFKYKDIYCAEDRIWAIEIWPLLGTEVHIDKHLYFNRSTSGGTEAQKEDKIKQSRPIVDSFRWTPFDKKK
jgi:glycosyltransferase involved in cell wall biosynthesis